MTRTKRANSRVDMGGIEKCPTGIQGFDEITGGGLPKGRPTLLVGSAGAGKTVFGMEFLVFGATQFGEPGVFIAFEETAHELAQNVASLGFNLNKLEKEKKLILDHVRVERSEIEETGEYDLEGLFVRIGLSIDTIGAKRIVLDSIEALFSGLKNELILRSELRRLFNWLKEKNVTAVITAEQGNGTFTRHGLEEYVSDAVVFLDHRIENQLSTRRLRVVKYRGSAHGTNEYPFLINKDGFEVLPITSLGLQHVASSERVSTGVPRLDTMMGGQGYYRGSTILVSGSAGSGKTSLASHFAAAACRRGEKCLYFAYEESESQVQRNMRSIGLDLEPYVKEGLLRYEATRPGTYGLEMHLALMHEVVERFQPDVIVIDPLSDLLSVGSFEQVKGMIVRMIDYLKSCQITTLMTSLTTGGASAEETEIGISSLIDTWIMVRDLETDGERTRGLFVLKSRGMAHSNQVREFLLTDHGVELLDVYIGPAGVLTGSARLVQEARERNEGFMRTQEYERQNRLWEQKRKKLEAQMAVLQAELAGEAAEAEKVLSDLRGVEDRVTTDRVDMAQARQADKP